MHKKLPKEKLRQLKDMCKQGNYDAIVALLQYHIEEGTEVCKYHANDHRYAQGRVKGLEDFFDDIVRKPE